jgi:tetratricopeptide (TPR) repeat protein
MKSIELRYDSDRKTTTIRDERGDVAYLKCLGTGEGHVLEDWKDAFFAELVEEFRLEPGRPCELTFEGEEEDFRQFEEAKVDFDGSCTEDIEITLVYREVPVEPEIPTPQMPKCRNCGFELKPHWVKCPKCKTPVAVESLNCQYCGESLEEWMDECPACGKSAAQAQKALIEKPPETPHNSELEKHKALANEYGGNNEWNKAIAEYTEALKINPDDVESLVRRGSAYCAQEDDTNAIADFTQAIQLKPNEAAPFFLRGRVYCYAHKDYANAIADLTQAIRFEPDCAKYFSVRGDAYCAQGDYANAIADYTQAIRLEPDCAEYFADRGTAYYAQEDDANAIADFTQAIRLDPNDARSFHDRGNVYYYVRKDYANAIADFTQAIRLDPNDARCFHDRGNAYYSQDDYANAIADYTQAIRFKPDYVDALYWRGQTYSKQGDYTEAIADFTQAIQLKPNEAEYFYNRGYAYLSKGDNTTAINDFSEAIKCNPDENVFYTQRARAYYNSGNLDLAIKDATTLIHNNPNDGSAYYIRGCYYHDQVVDAARLDNNHAMRHAAQAALQDLNAAIIHGALDVFKTYPYSIRSNVYLALNNVAQAKMDYQRALQIDPYLDKTRFFVSSYKDSSSGCFITTATCAALGKPDDCVELNAFRRFRDNWLLRQTDGQTLVDEYYRTAPAIVAAIDRSPEKNAAYSSLWREYLDPCLSLIEAGRFSECKEMYREMVVTLQNAWLQRI